ncbi:hypothetical protein HHO41_02265 [Bacillus sp. DNRA2]|uniref:hypothetical protein n=1 Tax=Bacillus sp. DNRA2 TaxID=2723053 RepID=UPI00145EE3B2|nr:hypothetical protein [Bacillus sp. DNRA2]NMD69097.1 hypothetical protein [Bacillus sp. DNRA2]
MDEKQRGKLGSFVYMAIVPLFFTTVFCLIFIYALDIPVKQSLQSVGNSIPIVKEIVPGESSSEETNIIDLKDELNEKNQQIADLKKQAKADEAENEVLRKTNQQLKEQLQKKQSNEYAKQVKKVAEIYADIPASKAAAMIETMTIEEATLTISMLKQSQQSSILSSMKDAKQAAQITMILKELASINEMDPSDIQEKIKEIVQQQTQAQ